MRNPIKTLLLASLVLSTSMVFAATTCPSRDAMPKGDITKAEHQKLSDARFDQMDTNKDGILTVEERHAAREAMRANCPRQGHGMKGSGPAVK